eukprot:CAMPEP_0174283100 /NCGR_PEP_ID=MMETSP0809-20121228/3724_1 /TAXON_ID=73025 ORGANISM="Eutreptiella gymnastica-like, Strain CCMP1594" /NCGR_SAMPLE_ID=MMETSP0809 /ASSEMBLY_ACC=CAM_ASM_000658 /LENGTH=122 /DNA_ID=CAMNT_0015377773 /DNA_START=293 /DNA_END=657 /DNA_ORIENTATION=+
MAPGDGEEGGREHAPCLQAQACKGPNLHGSLTPKGNALCACVDARRMTSCDTYLTQPLPDASTKQHGHSEGRQNAPPGSPWCALYVLTGGKGYPLCCNACHHGTPRGLQAAIVSSGIGTPQS